MDPVENSGYPGHIQSGSPPPAANLSWAGCLVVLLSGAVTTAVVFTLIRRLRRR